MSAPALRAGAQALGVDLSPAQEERLLRYLGLLQKWNRVYNLTAVTEPDQMLTHHILDSLAAVAPLRRHTATAAARLLDVGSGGGLPGVVVAACCAEVQVDCLDAVGKKAAFVQQAAGTLGLKNLRGLHGRAEAVRDGYDVVASRAFSSLADFTRLTRQALADGGVWMAMKGKRPDEEIAALPADIAVFHVEPVSVPGLAAERCLVWMRPAQPKG